MDFQKILKIIEDELKNLKNDEINIQAEFLNNKIIERANNSNNIYVYGAGRSGYVARSFVMRLVQLDLNAYMVGESSTPPMEKQDLLILISGSGKTQMIKDVVEISRRNDVETVLICSGMLEIENIDAIIPIYGKSKTSKDDFKTSLPLGSLFEINALIFLEVLIFKMVKDNKLEDRLRRIGKKYERDEIVVL